MIIVLRSVFGQAELAATTCIALTALIDRPAG